MSFLYKRLITYLDNLTRDPKAEAAEKQRIKQLKSAQQKANAKISAEKSIIEKAQVTQSPGRPEEALRYSIFPEDAKEILALLDNASASVANAEEGEDVENFMNDLFTEDYENYKINSILNTSVYPKATGARVGLWLILRAIKQLIHDNAKLSQNEIGLLKMIQDGVKKVLENTKYKKVSEWQPIFIEDLKNLDKYKNILNGHTDKIDKNSAEYKVVISLYPKIHPVVQKLLKNHGEVDFLDQEGDAFTGIITEEKEKFATRKINKSKDSFSILNLIFNAISYAVTIVIMLMFCFLLSLGSSMAVNLNVHKPLPFKIFYMIYGFLFGLIVVPYVLFYKWWWKGQKPIYYGFIPLIPLFFVNPTVQFLLGWMTYRPDDSIIMLEEWRHENPSDRIL